MIRCLIWGLCLACGWPAAAASSAELLRCNSSELSYKDLHQRDEDSRAALLCYKLVDDEDAAEGKALAVTLNKRLLKTGLFGIVSTPSLKDLPIGAYRVTVRLKMQGMLHSLASPINISTGRGLGSSSGTLAFAPSRRWTRRSAWRPRLMSGIPRAAGSGRRKTAPFSMCCR